MLAGESKNFFAIDIRRDLPKLALVVICAVVTGLVWSRNLLSGNTAADGEDFQPAPPAALEVRIPPLPELDSTDTYGKDLVSSFAPISRIDPFYPLVDGRAAEAEGDPPPVAAAARPGPVPVQSAPVQDRNVKSPSVGAPAAVAAKPAASGGTGGSGFENAVAVAAIAESGGIYTAILKVGSENFMVSDGERIGDILLVKRIYDDRVVLQKDNRDFVKLLKEDDQ